MPIDIELQPEEFAEYDEQIEIETAEKLMILKNKEKVQALHVETLRKFAELNAACDTAYVQITT